MKRLLMLAALSLAAVPLFLSSADAIVPVTGSDVTVATSRGFTELVSADTTPKRDRRRPYTFTTVGTISPPPRFCAPGTGPTSPTGPGNCIPIICPAGTTDPAYCVTPPRSFVCSGIVTVRIQRSFATISSRDVRLKADCSYSSTVRFNPRGEQRSTRLTVRALFQGNVLLTPAASDTETVRAG